MKIFVLVKQVPRTASVKLDPKTGSLIREGVASRINPDDRRALEAALRLKEAVAGTEVTAISMGPSQAVDVLTEALGLGADAGVLLTDRLLAGADTWATSTALSTAIEVLGRADLILAGRQAVDGDTAQIGPQVAEALGIPQATHAEELNYEDGFFLVTRRVEGGREVIKVRPPALVTVSGGPTPPRRVNVPALLRACEPAAALKVFNVADLGLKADQVGLQGSLTQVLKTFSPKAERLKEAFSGTPAEMAGAVAARLRELNLLQGSA